ncbi:MAG: aminoglycoside phosphotransferase family protein [Brachybacterium faecium]|nr:MAG: aminoglycoside phosphotransferase family protein [Brachybacterium faecium]
MQSTPAHDPSAAPDPVSPAMGERLQQAWSNGTLVLPMRDDHSPVRLPGLHKSVLPPSLSGRARVSLVGVGERFAAWRLTPQENASVIVRIPHVAPAELHQSLAHEIAALTLIPAEVGPDPIAFHDDAATSPIGHPYVVATDMPGSAAAPETWTPAHLAAHAEHLAHLHTVPAPGRGPVSLGEDPWAQLPAGPPGLLTEVEQLVEQWRQQHAAVIAEHHLEPFLEAALVAVAGIEPEIAAMAGSDGFVLAHGDLCATNVLWSHPEAGDDQPVVRYIDFEWAQADDPARDLAIIGGPVHGGPWYVPMDEPQVETFVDHYLRARTEHGEVPFSVADVPSLRRRMDAWTAYERTAMLVHVASRASTRVAHQRVLPRLRSTLAAFLGIGSRDDA